MKRPLAVVVGSGPTGVAAAHAALNRGARVVMLDVGLTLEPHRAEARTRMARVDPARWTRGDADMLADEPPRPTQDRVEKPVFGSDYPFRFESHFTLDRRGRVLLTPTLARGGFSNVWGATLLPYRADDLADWPLDDNDLAPYYEDILGLLPVAAHDDEMVGRYPLYTSSHRAHPLGAQARGLLRDLRRHGPALRHEGIFFGASRLAVRTGPDGCITCGHCLHGCPYGFIWSADHTLASLRAREGFEYRDGVFVERVADAAVEVRTEATGAAERISADRVFLGAGVLGTAAIVLASLGGDDTAVEVKDSQLFVLPLLQTRHDRSVLREGRMTLSEVFIDIDDQRVCPQPVRLQIYGYSDSVRRAAARAHPRLFPFAARGFDAAAPSLLTAFGYMHSRYSDSISVRFTGDSGGRRRLQLEPVVNPAGSEVTRRVASKLRSIRRQARMIPLSPLMQMRAAGESFHCGATFPMRTNPAGLETDLLGRLGGFERVHLVDASVFPSIPAGPITLSAMANASRIATESWDG